MFRKTGIFIKDIFLILLFFFLYINLEVFLWDLFQPEGFLGLTWFYLLSFFLLSFFIAVLELVSIISMESKTKKNVFLGILGLIFFLLISAVIEFGGVVYIPWKIYDRYKYIERSDRYFSKGKYDNALVFAEKVYKKQIKPLKNRSFIFPLSKLYRNSNHWENRENNEYYQALINLAYCFQASGEDIKKAEELFTESIDFSNIHFYGEKEYLIIPTMGRAKIYMARGDNTSAEKCYHELINLLDALDKKDVYNVIQILYVYAVFAEKNGEFDRAFNLHREALDVYNQSNKSKKSTFYFTLMVNVARDCIEMNNLCEAENHLKDCKRLARKKKKKSVYIDYLDLVARINELNGYTDKTEKLLNKIIFKVRRNQGRNHIDYAFSIYNLAAYYYKQRNYSTAYQRFNESLNIVAKQQKNQQVAYHDILLGSAISDYSVGEIKDFEEKISKIESFLFNQINEIFLFLSHEEKENYISSVENRFIQINSILALLSKPELNERLYNNILATKKIALQSNQYYKDFILKFGSKNLVDDYNDLLRIKEETSELQYAGIKDNLLFNQIHDSIRLKERQIYSIIREFKNFTGYQVNSVTWEDIRDSIGANEVVVEYIELPVDPTSNDEIWYYALIVKSDFNFPQLIKLCDKDKLTDILNKDGTTKEKIEEIYSSENIIELKNLIWQPIRKYFSNVDKVYISLAGILYQISFPAIIHNEYPEIIFLSSTRSLVENKNQIIASQDSTSILYGDIDYSAEKESLGEDNFIVPESSNQGVQKNILRSEFQLLPNTKSEVLGIIEILESHNYMTKLYTGKDATERSFKYIPYEQPGIIHIATHGFYYPSELSYRVNELLFDDVDYNTTIQNPLFRSGLLFAGANKISHHKNEDDGVLTAYEISQLNLSDVNLVVLSACETGLGDIKGNEGVYGLQRAFKLAGVKSIIMSLWKVPDEQTAELMQEFYKYYLEGFSKQAALNLSQQRLSKKYPSPFYWAGFVIVE